MNVPRRGTPDFLLLFLTFSLVCFGLAMVFSASSMTSATSPITKGDPWFFTKKQAIAVVIGTIGMLFCMNIHYSKLKKLVLPAFLVILIMLTMVPFGISTKGANSWFYIGSFGLQPSEFAKLGIILYLAALISNKGDKFRQFKKGLLPALCIVGLVCFLIMLQPDLGSCMIVLFCAVIVIAVGGSNLKHVFLLGVSGAAIAAIGVSLFLLNSDPLEYDYRIHRLTGFLNPWDDPLGGGYQIIQSLYAFGHGGLVGAGFGQGIQKLHYLPEAHNDFIFAIIGEELGFIGIAIFLLIYLLFIWRGILISVRCTETFGMLSGIGIMGMIAFQAVINIGGVTGTIPLTGVTLPFISYGGTSMMITLISMGVLLGISREQSSTADKSAKKT
ncbi:putative lipid II flippase FtsW [Paenibacillus eucommiae]|uniref:Probable peptidoglycan glycosyltransferase FtsW n=1 Tax=Paenibacillus eucommiae TaxID=1355755 RepID=A0ABS4J9E3_9BACL|nr:putative lipid II flippase FtsW [Paenibacillus eucommiae]MBP1996478.1 cell division protein FtsW [Paenibacillus eucommiae]